jgi:hypothetical protein
MCHFFKSFAITNASMMRTPEQESYFVTKGMGFAPHFTSKVKVALSDDKDKNIATLLIQLECYSRETSLFGSNF